MQSVNMIIYPYGTTPSSKFMNKTFDSVVFQNSFNTLGFTINLSLYLIMTKRKSHNLFQVTSMQPRMKFIKMVVINILLPKAAHALPQTKIE